MANVKASRNELVQSTYTAGHGNRCAEDFVNADDAISALFSQYDTNGDGVIDLGELSALARRLFHTRSGDPITDRESLRLMQTLDFDKDGVLSRNEFLHAWHHCFKKAIDPVTALVIVDVQHDFIDGSLALKHCPAAQDGAEVLPVINSLLAAVPFDVVIYTVDWHPPNHISFVENVSLFRVSQPNGATCHYKIYDKVQFDLDPPREQILWPKHCVQGTPGADLHKNLVKRTDGITIHKGTKPDVDSYSAFWDNSKLSETGLYAELKKRNVSDVYVCGLAYDICVGATATDAMDYGFRTVVVEDACRGTSVEGVASTRDKLQELGAILVTSDQVDKMVKGEVCPFELGLFAAKSMPKDAQHGAGTHLVPAAVSHSEKSCS